MPSKFDELKAKLLAKDKKKTPPEKPRDGLSTGLTLLNLAISGSPDYGLRKGHYYLFVGASRAGKSMLGRKLMGEATLNPSFKKYRLIDDDPERGSLMDLENFFGKEMAARRETPKEGHSKTLEGFYYNLDDIASEGKPFIYLLDSEDALDSEDEVKKFQKNKRAFRKRQQGEKAEEAGTFGVTKPKKNSSMLRTANNCLEATNSMLVIIKQSRTNMGFGSQFNPETRNGGVALTFFATAELWFSIKAKITKTERGKRRVIGTLLEIKLKKNRVAGQDCSVLVRFYPDDGIGFDDVGSCVDYLIEEKHWKKKGVDDEKKVGGDVDAVKIEAPEFNHVGSVGKLITTIQDEGREEELRALVVKVWNEIREACKVERKRRYS